MPDPDPASVDLDAWIDALLPVLGIADNPVHRPGIRTNLLVTMRFARLVLDFPLDEREEPAPIFEP